MKKCKECGYEVADDVIHCPNCGEYIGGYSYCKACGTKLVNDYERAQGICVNCEGETPSKIASVSISPVKYLKRLRVLEILCYICGALTILSVAALNSGLLIIGIISIVPWMGLGTIFGVLREILKRQK